MELLEYYDKENLNKIGIEERSIIHKKGLWHREIAVWVINQKKEILLQKRSSFVKRAPNKYYICAGHININEEPEFGAIRELFEEIGLSIDINQLQPLGIYKNEDVDNNHYKYTYLVRTKKDITEYIMQEEEVSELKYISIDYFESMLENDNPDLAFSKKDYPITVIRKLKNLI